MRSRDCACPGPQAGCIGKGHLSRTSRRPSNRLNFGAFAGGCWSTPDRSINNNSTLSTSSSTSLGLECRSCHHQLHYTLVQPSRSLRNQPEQQQQQHVCAGPVRNMEHRGPQRARLGYSGALLELWRTKDPDRLPDQAASCGGGVGGGAVWGACDCGSSDVDDRSGCFALACFSLLDT